MARSVTFNGVTRYRPGGISRVSTVALTPVSGGGNIIAFLGEAEKGAPGSERLYVLNDGTRAIEYFGEGDLATAIQFAFGAGADPLIPGGASEVVVYKTNSSTQATADLPGLLQNLVPDTTEVDTGASVTVIPVTGATLTPGELVGNWAIVEVNGQLFGRKVTGNDASSITLDLALPAAPAQGSFITVVSAVLKIKSTEYGEGANGVEFSLTNPGVGGIYELQFVTRSGTETQVSPRFGGTPHLVVEYKGGTVVASGVIDAGTTADTVVIAGGALTPGDHDGQICEIGGQRVRIVSNTADTLTLEAPGLSPETLEGLEPTSEVSILDVTGGYARFVSSTGGQATAFETVITGGPGGHNRTIAITPSTTLAQIASELEATGVYSAWVYPGKDPNFLASQMDFVDPSSTLDETSGDSVVADIARTFVDTHTEGNLGLYAQVAELIALVDEVSEHVTVERATGSPGAGGSISGAGGITYDMIASIQNLTLSGAVRGTSSNSDWQAGLDKLLQRRVDYVVPLIDADLASEGHGSTATWASVSQQLKDHVIQARGAVGLERGAFIGLKANKDRILHEAGRLGDEDIQLVAQDVYALDSTGNLKTMGPRVLAAIAAGCRAGVGEIGEPLTNKYIRIAGLSQHHTWEPSDLTDSVDMIKAGVLFAEEIVGEGFRWVRDLTTHTRTDHLAYTEGSVRDIVRRVVYTLRTDIDKAFTGRKALPATIGNVRNFAASRLDIYRDEGVITDSTDPATGETIYAYYGLRVTSTGDTIRLCVGFFPVPGINFQLDDIYVAIPSQVAA